MRMKGMYSSVGELNALEVPLQFNVCVLEGL